MNRRLLYLLGLWLFPLLNYAQQTTFEDYRKRADNCLEQRDYTCAVQNYERALRIRENDTHCSNGLQKARQMLKTTPKPKLQTPETTSARPSNNTLNVQNDPAEQAQKLFLEADSAYQTKNYELCLQKLEQVRKVLGNATNARIQYLTVKALVGQQKWEEAKKNLAVYLTYNDRSASRAEEMQQTQQLIEKKLKPSATAVQQPVVTDIPNTSPNEEVPPKTTQPAPKLPPTSGFPTTDEPKSATTNKPAPLPNTVPNLSVRPNRRIGLKILTAAIGAGSGAYAYLLHRQFNDKATALKEVSLTTDPENDGIITNRADFTRWESTYNDTKAAQEKKTLFNVCLGVAATAAVTELFLLLHKPKPKRLSWHPSINNLGFAVCYRL